jgi:hypothetical protein
MSPSYVVPKMMKATKGKQPQQRKMLSKEAKAKQLVQLTAITQANLKLPSDMMQSNKMFVMGKPMLTVNALDKAGQACVDLHNYYINNYKLGQDIIVTYKDHHFLVGDDIFLISFSDLYDLFNLDALDVSLMRCFAL